MARRLFMLALCAWLVTSTGAVAALVSFEAGHDRDHHAREQSAHDEARHVHDERGVELYSELFGNPGFDQLLSGWIVQCSPMPGHHVSRVAPAQDFQGSVSALLNPPPGPPPRIIALSRGGITG